MHFQTEYEKDDKKENNQRGTQFYFYKTWILIEWRGNHSLTVVHLLIPLQYSHAEP